MCGDGEGKMTKAYAAYNKDAKIRLQSSSGGVFHALAVSVIEEGGVVFGVRFDERFRAVYDTAETVGELERMQGAKYVLPSMDGVCERVGKYLKEGRKVLFTGLPCHTAGLYASLRNRETDRLVCADLVCHGTPERAAWEAYLRHEEEKTGEIKNIRMRDKSKGWADYRIVIESSSGKVKSEPAAENLYMRGYTRDLFLRRPCYDCRFRGVDRLSDITLGDYWGVSARHRELDTSGGVSLVFVHSQKGMELLNRAKERLVCTETDAGYACAHNPAVTHSPKLPEGREDVLAQLRGGTDFSRCVKPYLRERFTTKFRRKIRKFKIIFQNK